MKINIDGIKALGDVLEEELSYDKLKKLTKVKSVSRFIDHEKTFNRDIDKFIFILEIIRLKTYEDYVDKFNLYILKENLSGLYEDLEWLKADEEKIIKEALDKVYDLVPSYIDINPKIYLYGGGIDGAFTLYGKEIFINYIKYLGSSEEFIKVVSHELFHCRNIPLKVKLRNYFQLNIRERYLYEVLGKIFEEGIALLIQHGNVLKKDDPVGSITREKLNLVDREFEKLNLVLEDIKGNSIEYINTKTIDYYALGYYMVRFLYDFYNREVLLPWILDLDYRTLIKSYILGIREEGKERGFSKNIEFWLMNL